MEDYRSRSYADGRNMQNQMEDYRGFRSNSLPYGASAEPPLPPPPPPPKLKKGKSSNGSISKSWSLNDPEFQRKRRVASYKVYSVEGNVKGSFRKSFRWLKDRYYNVIHGWW